MEDIEIIDLFFCRDENAIKELSAKYHAYCHRIALNFVGSIEDAEECVNDTWLAAWSYMPPKRPANLPAFVGRTRGALRSTVCGRNMQQRGRICIWYILSRKPAY